MLHSELSTKEEVLAKSHSSKATRSLPGRGLRERIAGLALAVGCGAILLGIPYLTNGHIPFVVLLLLFPILIVVAIGGLRMAFGSTSLPERYRARARRLSQSDPEQAVVDYTEALKLSEGTNRPAFRRTILYERAQIFKRLGQMDDAIADLDLYVQSLKRSGGAGASVRIATIEEEVKRLKNETRQ